MNGIELQCVDANWGDLVKAPKMGACELISRASRGGHDFVPYIARSP